MKGHIYQIKITLKEIKPPIWRRFLVRGDMTFKQLNEVVQVVMGWTNTHLYEFDVKGKPILDYELFDGDYDEDTELDAAVTKLNELVTKEKQTFDFMYDFGDGWEHTLVVEKITPDDGKVGCSVCLEGERNCPPEDCGGPWGYEEYLQELRKSGELDPSAKVGRGRRRPFDPEEFDLKMVNKMLAEM